MRSETIFEYDLVKDCTELRKLIAENPKLPICVLVGQDVYSDYRWTYCEFVVASIGEVLDCEVPYMETVETDRDNFNEQIEEWLFDKMCEEEFNDEGEPSERYFKERLSQEKKKYEPYWKKCIFVYADV